ncbi:hypothetical protein ACFL35_15015 [Candidatus Riflebacteria bacterium]
MQRLLMGLPLKTPGFVARQMQNGTTGMVEILAMIVMMNGQQKIASQFIKNIKKWVYQFLPVIIA